jgi:hypothetical protein
MPMMTPDIAVFVFESYKPGSWYDEEPEPDCLCPPAALKVWYRVVADFDSAVCEREGCNKYIGFVLDDSDEYAPRTRFYMFGVVIERSKDQRDWAICEDCLGFLVARPAVALPTPMKAVI